MAGRLRVKKELAKNPAGQAVWIFQASIPLIVPLSLNSVIS
jgi:hypothetical protein